MSETQPSADLVVALSSTDARARIAALAQIGTAGTATAAEIEAMAGCLLAREKVVQRRCAEAFAALDRNGVEVEPILVSALRSAEITGRWGAAYALSLIRPTSAREREVLAECLGLDDGDIRWAAADLLLRNPADDLDTDLLRLLRHGSDNQRKMAAYCLRALGRHTETIERALAESLADAASGVRLAAIAALARLAKDRMPAAAGIAKLLQDDDSGVRRAAAATLGELGVESSTVMNSLAKAVDSDDESLRRAATRSLEKLRPHHATKA